MKLKPKIAAILSLLIPACLVIATGSLLGRSRILFFAYVGVQLAILIASRRDAEGMAREVHAWTIHRRYRPRPTDAGQWVDAPIAEVDKSTLGKLLASRMHREPGLQVVVRGNNPAACSDELYDPELDGQPAPTRPDQGGKAGLDVDG